MSSEVYWQSKTVIVDWVLADPDTGEFIPGVTVAGTVTLPDETTAAMTVTELADRYRATYDPQVSGTVAYRLVATGDADSAEEGTFVVLRSLLGMPPITVDPASDIGRVRLLATDLNETSPLFEDAQIAAFLAMESGVKRAAALALETIAVSETLISKKLRTGDGLVTDGPAVAKALLDRAKRLRDQADEETGDPDDYGLEIVNYDPYAAYRSW
jgi:hypothetical protein